MIILYILLAFIATFVGAITGIGGGVILKPVMDLFGNYDVATIGVLSSVTIFSMATVSCIRRRNSIKKTNPLNLVLLGIGSMVGGFLGQAIFETIRQNLNNDSLIKIVQNSILCFLIILIFVYMLNKNRIKGLGLKHFTVFLGAGIFLGAISSFLGIGGGPIIVAFLLFLFSMDMKSAAISSIVTIFFAQFSKLSMVLVTTGFGIYNLEVLPYMVGAAIIGATLGAVVIKTMKEKAIVLLFNTMLIFIMGICVYNIISMSL